MDSGGISPRIPNLGTRGRWVVNFKPRRFHRRGKSPGTHWIGWEGTQTLWRIYDSWTAQKRTLVVQSVVWKQYCMSYPVSCLDATCLKWVCVRSLTSTQFSSNLPLGRFITLLHQISVTFLLLYMWSRNTGCPKNWKTLQMLNNNTHQWREADGILQWCIAKMLHGACGSFSSSELC